MPVRPGVGRSEQGGILDAGEDGVGIGEGRLEMPDPGELPRMRRPVVPLVRARHAVVGKLVPYRLPRGAAVVGTLDQLPEPARGLRRVQPVGVCRGTLDVVDLPARKQRTLHVPALASGVGGQHESALPGAYQYTHTAHPVSSPRTLKLLLVDHLAPRNSSLCAQRAVLPCGGSCSRPPTWHYLGRRSTDNLGAGSASMAAEPSRTPSGRQIRVVDGTARKCGYLPTGPCTRLLTTEGVAPR